MLDGFGDAANTSTQLLATILGLRAEEKDLKTCSATPENRIKHSLLPNYSETDAIVKNTAEPYGEKQTKTSYLSIGSCLIHLRRFTFIILCKIIMNSKKFTKTENGAEMFIRVKNQISSASQQRKALTAGENGILVP